MREHIEWRVTNRIKLGTDCIIHKKEEDLKEETQAQWIGRSLQLRLGKEGEVRATEV